MNASPLTAPVKGRPGDRREHQHRLSPVALLLVVAAAAALLLPEALTSFYKGTKAPASPIDPGALVALGEQWATGYSTIRMLSLLALIAVLLIAVFVILAG
ncbi:hypothetical protein [Micromonospora palythoicola]|uniref:hypothetical protein n=1 Tax=Micromonospora palythoicola TaxID=3120507 RepID=UPI002FCE14D9